MFIQIRPNFKLISSEFPARKIMKIRLIEFLNKHTVVILVQNHLD